MASRFSAAADGAGDGTWLEIAKLRDLPEQHGSIVD